MASPRQEVQRLANAETLRLTKKHRKELGLYAAKEKARAEVISGLLKSVKDPVVYVLLKMLLRRKL